MKKPRNIHSENFKFLDATGKMSKKNCMLDFVVNINLVPNVQTETQQP